MGLRVLIIRTLPSGNEQQSPTLYAISMSMAFQFPGTKSPCVASLATLFSQFQGYMDKTVSMA